MASRISVISSVRNTPVTAQFTRDDHMSMYVLKTANAIRNRANARSSHSVVTAMAATSFVPLLAVAPEAGAFRCAVPDGRVTETWQAPRLPEPEGTKNPA